ncbi:DUF4232 domain-containing protein [Streptomyces sp. NPDC047000]|uniref:DUF4232 domain-containing protein n=1 Tax=Streptomyces sp. NPDC047000 TaxID=3155474 RepID=UPI0033F4CF71
MQHLKGIRRAVATTAVVTAALAVTACQPAADGAGTGKGTGKTAGTAPKAPGTAAPASSSPAAKASPAAPVSKAPSGPGKSTASAATATTAPGASAAGCAASALKVSARQAAVRPDGTGTGAAVVGFRNTSGKPCVLQGRPTVAGAGNGSPGKNRPLAVTPSGPASPVTLAPGGTGWVKLTFVQVQGEADGYCVSGATPSSYPTIVIGLPGAGQHQVALDDGVFAECGDTVTATAVSAAEPS